MIVLVGCGSPVAPTPKPTQASAATNLSRVFQSRSATTAPVASTPTDAPVVATPWVPQHDRRVQADCAPLSVSNNTMLSNADLSIDVQVDVQSTGRSISPLIYGLASGAEPDYYRDLGTTFIRWGGNQVTRHNWEINASNAGSDWLFANVPHSKPGEGPGAAADLFIETNKSLGADGVLTIPAIGYVAKDGDNNTRSQNVPAESGPPLGPGAEAIPGYDPATNQGATSIKSYSRKGQPFSYPPDLGDYAVYQDEWIAYLTEKHGRAEEGGLRYYSIDNEPDLWAETHRDIHPARMGYDGMLAMFKEYAEAIKTVDSSASIVAPELSGVTAFYYSALDRGNDRFNTHVDRSAHDGMPFLPWFLDQVRRYDQHQGRRSLDVVSVHHYPQGGEFSDEDIGRDVDTNARRLRSTQQLWNFNYTDESWIRRTEAYNLALIPRLKGWVNLYYPGTKIGITEWNYGADDTVNGALAIADVLGIFGREGVDIAAYWRFPKPGTPGASAFKLYGNYDNCGRHFGDEVLETKTSNHLTLSAFSSRDSHSGDILIMAINKETDKAVEARIRTEIGEGRGVQVYQFDQQRPVLSRLADIQTDVTGFSYTVPAYSATLFVIKR